MKPRLPLPALMLVTDRRLCQNQPLERKVELAIEGGVSIVQLREKDLPAGELLELALRLREAIRGRALLLVNERVDVALATEADGVQLGEAALPTSAARRVLGEGPLIGRSVHSLEGARQAEASGADFLLVGPIFPTASKPGAQPAGVGLLRQICKAVALPVIAIGGIKAANVAEAMGAGAAGVAVISSILAAPEPREAAAQLAGALRHAWLSRSAAEVAG